MFDLDAWKKSASDKLRQVGRWIERFRNEDAPHLVYGTVCSLSLWPLVEAAQKGQLLPVFMALGGVAGGVGGNLIAEQIQRWKDRADEINENEVAQWVNEQAANSKELCEALDAILERLDAVTEAQAALDNANQQWFNDTLKVELARLGNLPRFEAKLTGSGTIVQGQSAKGAGERGVAADTISAPVATGNNSRAVQAETYIERQEIVHQAPSPIAVARTQYLKRLSQRCNVLPLAALGGDEGTGEEVSLDQIYIDLDTQTRVPLSEKRKAKRQEAFSREEDHPLSALEAATQHRRLALLGDPGSGKSSFVRYLAVWLAEACLGQRAAPPGWEEGLLPVLVTLRELTPRLAGLALEGITEKDRHRQLLATMWGQWRAELEDLRASGFAQGLEEALTDGQVVLIFDGLDEVPEKLRRRVRESVKAVQGEYPTVWRVIVTCRKRSYTGSTVLPGFTAHTLAPFDSDRIARFVKAWYSAQVALDRMDQDKARKKAQDLEAVALSRELGELSPNPMLLTTMAIIHQRDVGLPNERVRLYARVVEVLLSRWQKHKGIPVSKALEEVLKDDLKLRSILERLAFEVHQLQAAQGEGSNLLRKDVLGLLEQPAYLKDAGLASEFLDYVDQCAGLLIGHGGGEEGQKPQIYSFPHRTFQEYLAGCQMVSGRGRSIAREYWKRTEEGDYWYLAACMGAEELRYNVRNGIEMLLDLAYALCPAATPDRKAAWRAILWSGQMAALVGQGEVQRDQERPEGGQVYLDRLLPRLVQILQGNQLGAIERAEAGRVLARLDDPRPEVVTIDAMRFCLVPAGPFWMGEGDEEHLNECLDYDYWIARYPVTNAQFAAFIKAGGYRKAHYWREAEAHGFWKGGQVQGRWDNEPRDRPVDYSEPFNLSNHPVVGITWYEALAFSRWLTERWRMDDLLADCWKVRLPSEAEWEKAARGGVEIPVEVITRNVDTLKGAHELCLAKNPEPKRLYPWDDSADPNRANYDRTNINASSAVGCFAQEATPYGCLDMAGNVWEWTRSNHNHYPYIPTDGREDFSASPDVWRVLRGGAFGDVEAGLRCAVRDGGDPGDRNRYDGFRLVVSPL